MAATIQISFRNMEAVPAAEEQVHALVAELSRLFDRLTGCRVVVDAIHRHRHQGRSYQVRLELSVPEGPIIVNCEASTTQSYDDLSLALHDAFAAVRQRLQDHVARLDEGNRPHEP